MVCGSIGSQGGGYVDAVVVRGMAVLALVVCGMSCGGNCVGENSKNMRTGELNL